MLLKECCVLVKDKIDSSKLNKLNYISTENLNPNFNGFTEASSLPNGKVTKFKNGDILISNIRPYFKKGLFCNFDGGCSNDVFCVRNNSLLYINQYLYYAISSDNFINQLVSSCKGTKMPRGDKNVLLNYNLPDIDIAKQQHIVNILGSIDDKIETNDKMINNLEKANKLFFSKNYINNSNNESWKLVRLEECVDISRGASPRPIQEYLANDGMPWVKISDATETDSNFISKTHEFIIESGISKSRTVTKGMLIVSNSATPALTRIMNITACVHDGWLILDNFSPLSKEIVKYIIDFNKKELISSGNGSVFTNLKTEILKSLQVKIPPQPIMDKITDRLKSNLDMQLQLTEENKKLNELKQLYLKKFFG